MSIAHDERARELISLAQRIREWQRQHRYSDVRMVQTHPGLGSTKTYARILAGDLEELDLDRWLRDYRSVLALIETLGDDASEDVIYDDLTTVIDVRSAVARAMRETCNARVVLVQGPSGSGKTSAAKAVAARYGARVLMIEANETWKESPGAMLAGLLEALGSRGIPQAASERLGRIISILRESRRCIVIDEAHHLGPRTLNLVKTIVNQAPCEVVLLALGTLWQRLETQAYAEARQLTTNRLAERVRLDAVRLADVQLLLVRQLGIDGDAAKAARIVAEAARQHGCLAFVRQVCREAKHLAGTRPVTLEHVSQGVSNALATR